MHISVSEFRDNWQLRAKVGIKPLQDCEALVHSFLGIGVQVCESIITARCLGYTTLNVQQTYYTHSLSDYMQDSAAKHLSHASSRRPSYARMAASRASILPKDVSAAATSKTPKEPHVPVPHKKTWHIRRDLLTHSSLKTELLSVVCRCRSIMHRHCHGCKHKTSSSAKPLEL